MAPVHVLQVLGNAIVGGMESCVLQLAERLPRERVRLSALLPFEGTLAARLRDAGVAVTVLPLPDEPPWASVQAAAALCQAGRVDLLHAHLPNAHLLAALAGALTHTPVLTTVHAQGPSPLDLTLHRLVKSHVSVVCRPGWQRALGAGFDPARLSCEPNGVDTRRFAPRPPEARAAAGGLRARLGLAADTPLVGFVGRLSPEKGPEVFVHAAAALHRVVPGAHAVLVGEGPQEGALRAQAAALGLLGTPGSPGPLHFAGLGTDMPSWLPELDVLLLSSHTEAMPLVLLEAMACGVPMVATRVGAVDELVEPGGTGFVVPPGDADAAAQAVARLLADGALRRRCGARARARAVARFDLEPAVARMATLMERLARPRRGHGRCHQGRASTCSRRNTMKKFLIASMVVVGTLGAGGCAVKSGQSTMGQYVDDATISTRVKARLAEDPAVSAMRIQVETLNGTVQLAGFAASQNEKDKAGQLARNVPDVKDVRNNIIVRSAATGSGTSTGN